MDVDTLIKAMPGLDRATATRYLPLMERAMLEFGIDNPKRAQMWLAQVGHESGSLRYMEEIASGAAYEGRTDLGNTVPGDGVRFKGRGPIQITGRYNYEQAGKALNLPLTTNPKLASDPGVAFRLSAWWWKTHGLNEISDTGDVTAATRRINGGLNGLDDRQSRYRIATALGDAALPNTVHTPITEEDYLSVTAAVSSAGHLHVFVEAKDGRVFYTWQSKGESKWNGGKEGVSPASLILFAPSPVGTGK